VLNKLFQIIRDQQKIPEDWNEGLLKIGELKTCGNWKGMTMMTTAAKVMGRGIHYFYCTA